MIKKICEQYGAVQIDNTTAFKLMLPPDSPSSPEEVDRHKRVIISALVTSVRYREMALARIMEEKAKRMPLLEKHNRTLQKLGEPTKRLDRLWRKGWNFNNWKQAIGCYQPPLRVVAVPDPHGCIRGFITRSLRYAVRRVVRGEPCALCQGVGWGIVWRLREGAEKATVQRRECPKCEGLLFA